MGCCDGAKAFEHCVRHLPQRTHGIMPHAPLGKLKVNLRETDEKMIVEAELPGFEKEDISVLLADTTLSISAQKQENSKENDGYFFRESSSQTSYQRSILLPFEIDEDQVKAYYNAGVLRVDIPKPSKEDNIKNIEIN
jgi:HSP20 family protein